MDGQKKDRLLDIFGHWTDMVTDLIKATPEGDVLRRDIFDRPPIFKYAAASPFLLQVHHNLCDCSTWISGWSSAGIQPLDMQPAHLQ